MDERKQRFLRIEPQTQEERWRMKRGKAGRILTRDHEEEKRPRDKGRGCERGKVSAC